MYNSQFAPQDNPYGDYPSIPAEKSQHDFYGQGQGEQVDFYGQDQGAQFMGGQGGFGSDHANFSGEIGGGDGVIGGGSFSGGGPGFLPEEEPPLLEELGIDLGAIVRQTKAVCFPSSLKLPVGADASADLAGPLLFCLLLGSALLLRGRVHFGYIYGLGVTGCLGVWLVLNLMSQDASRNGISFDMTSSVLGYSLLPIVLLAFMTLLLDLTGPLGLVVIAFHVSWCTFSATRFIEQALAMKPQRWLIAYPVWLLYAVFALVTVF